MYVYINREKFIGAIVAAVVIGAISLHWTAHFLFERHRLCQCKSMAADLAKGFVSRDSVNWIGAIIF